MNQVSRPMQIALAAALVFVALWFTVLRPKDPAIEPVAATPVSSTTPAAAGSVAGALENDVNKAKSTAANADADAAKSSAQTGEETTTPATSPKAAANATSPKATSPKATTPKAAAPKATTPVATTPAQRAAAAKDALPAAQKKANKVIETITKDLAARRAVVVLIWSDTGTEDRELKRRVTKEINRRHGKVRVYLIPVSAVGRYDGLLSGLSISQTPSTVVIAPDNQAKVLGGLTSTQRIDRLTSSALQLAPAKTTP